MWKNLSLLNVHNSNVSGLYLNYIHVCQSVLESFASVKDGNNITNLEGKTVGKLGQIGLPILVSFDLLPKWSTQACLNIVYIAGYH